MEVKPLEELTKTLSVLLKISIAITAVAFFVDFYDYHSYANLPLGADPNEAFLPSDAVSALVGLTQLVLMVILGVTFLRWIYRANNNLRILSGEQMTFTPGWSVGWYFIPIACLFKPYQVMKEIWQVSHKNESTTNSILGVWWSLWIVSSFLGNIALRQVMRADDTDAYITSALIYIFSDGVDVILNIVALMLVTRIGDAYSRNIIEQEAHLEFAFDDTPLPSVS